MIVSRIEAACIVPEAIERVDAGVAQTVLQVKLRSSLERVLRKELIKIGAVRSLGARTDFGVGVVKAESSVGKVVTRAVLVVGSVEVELAILVVGLACGRRGECDLVAIVFPRAFIQCACL